jgi:hypothetical protein
VFELKSTFNPILVGCTKYFINKKTPQRWCFFVYFFGVSLQFGSNSFYPKFLTETRPRKPARRRSLQLATQQKSFLCISDFARAGFFLLKGKENFFVGFCSERAGRRGWPLFFARTRRNSPHTLPFFSAVFLRGRTEFLAAANV